MGPFAGRSPCGETPHRTRSAVNRLKPAGSLYHPVGSILQEQQRAEVGVGIGCFERILVDTSRHDVEA